MIVFIYQFSFGVIELLVSETQAPIKKQWPRVNIIQYHILKNSVLDFKFIFIGIEFQKWKRYDCRHFFWILLTHYVVIAVIILFLYFWLDYLLDLIVSKIPVARLLVLVEEGAWECFCFIMLFTMHFKNNVIIYVCQQLFEICVVSVVCVWFISLYQTVHFLKFYMVFHK